MKKNIFEGAKYGDRFEDSCGNVFVYIRKSNIPNNPVPHQLDSEEAVRNNEPVLGRTCYTDEGIHGYALVDNWEDKTYMSIVKKL